MRVLLKHLRGLGLLGAIFLISTKCLVADNLSDFQLISVNSEYFYYNFEYKNKALFLGSSEGVLAYKDPTHVQLIDKEKKGYVYLENEELKSSIYLKGNIYTPHYKLLLPEEFRHNAILGTTYQNKLMLISKGQLFIFKKTIKPKADTLSIRTISSHFLGTYGGIFQNGKRFTYPEYTNGYIREFPGETFICYDGLLRLKGIDTLRYEANGGNTQIGKVDIGKVKDVFKIDSSRYLLFSSKGLSISDLKTNVRWIERNNSDREPRFLKSYNRDNLAIVIYYAYGNKIQKFNLLNNSYTTLFQINPSLGNIEDAYFNSASNIYLLTENKLIKAISDSEGKNFLFETLAENLIGNHHIIPYDANHLLVTSNDGLSTYNLDTHEWIPHLIRDEFNHRAVFMNGNTLLLGTIHGYYELSKTQIEQLISSRLEELVQEREPSFADHRTEIIYGLTAICVLLLSLTLYLITRPSKSAIDNKAKASAILSYIDDNLKDVTIVNICHEFNINPLQLNDILKTDKPGELIRSKRLDLVRKMRKDRRREEDIAQVTGFSVSYLKKIKA
ncbi:hypothetical protein [Aquirufa lenticrescens]|uniref:hypothetical protein n=1 Tax=Aquirufa lenticrescens TaxID=2696560 RepID=UPI001CAA7986|nr:hypothetical protein [Aquirufa lenticrescens]UAJ14022.1 hypothetical protein G9X62_05410 [Aquirufa lenticrescens]